MGTGGRRDPSGQDDLSRRLLAASSAVQGPARPGSRHAPLMTETTTPGDMLAGRASGTD